MMQQLPFAITGGDCAGIGPEITAKACEAFPEERFYLYTHRALFERACQTAGIRIPSNIIWKDIPFTGEVNTICPGENQASVGELAYQSVVVATHAALRGEVRAIVTAPFSKAALHLAGHHLPGHTELIAQICGKKEATMAFFSSTMVISLATIHIALHEVPHWLTRERLLRVFKDTAEALTRRLKRRPKIGVLALNPHAGEAGAFGNEEAHVIIPAIKEAKIWGDFIGPLVPDTALIPSNGASAYDGFVAMYHDQGLIPFKLMAFDQGVNVTLGLPVLRTSPDHGTAFNLAWQGKASATSMIAAIHCAQELSS
jgi:4-hydroxythreonine-4-phosphate dehydrogenase